MIKLLTIITCTIMLISCNNPRKTDTKGQKENEIKVVSISTFGGMSTILSKTFIITKDSVLYSLYAVDSAQNIVKSYPNNQQDWKKLLGKIDLEKFKSAIEGESHQTYDGNDTEITIITQDGKFSKVNADKNQSWDNVRNQLVKTYYK